MSTFWPWLALAGLGAFHGLNPAMGWLFAVARGLQEGRREVVVQSMLPIAAGHALSVGVIVLVVGVLRVFIDLKRLQIGAAVVIMGFGLYRLVARHRGRPGMQLRAGELLLWSFLMASAHGAGLMLIPVLLGMPMGAQPGMHAHHSEMVSLQGSTTTALLAVGIHTLAMLTVAGAVALAVYEWIGVAFLRRGWVNLDFIWVPALLAAGLILLGMALL